MISVEAALGRITAAFAPLGVETVPLAEALGRVLAEDVAAKLSQPPVAVSAMDGYAVRAADISSLPARLRCVGEAPAGGSYGKELGRGEAVRIFTGGPVPAGADTIVIQENTTAEGGAETGHVTVIAATPPGRYIRPAGLDFRQGEIGLKQGRRLTPRDIGLAAAMNLAALPVRCKPRIAVLATGDELVPLGTTPGPHQIISSNGVGLAAFIAAQGGLCIDLGIARDSIEQLREAAGKAEGHRSAGDDRRGFGRRPRSGSEGFRPNRLCRRFLAGRDAAGKAAVVRPDRTDCRSWVSRATRFRPWCAP